MGVVEQLVKGIEERVRETLPAYKRAAFFYDVSRNNLIQKDGAYAIRAVGAASGGGVTRAVTLSQRFEVELVKSFIAKNDTDEGLRDVLFSLHADLEALYRALMPKQLGSATDLALLVSLVDISDPIIDNEGKTAGLIATFTINYRTY